MDRIIILDELGCPSNPFIDLEEILLHINGVNRKVSPEIINNFSSSFSELKLALIQYSKRLNNLLKKGSPDLNHYIPELQQIDTKQKKVLLEVYDTELSYNFKAFIIFSKAVMDRLIPFFDYKCHTHLRKFSKKGKSLLNYLKNNYEGSNQGDFINLLVRNKQGWLDELVNLRDEIVHFSALREYISFHHIWEGNSGKSIKSINDLAQPILMVNRKEILAKDFLTFNFDCIKTFAKDFVTLCYA